MHFRGIIHYQTLASCFINFCWFCIAALVFIQHVQYKWFKLVDFQNILLKHYLTVTLTTIWLNIYL